MTVNSFVGPKKQWKSGLASYAAVSLGEVYHGVTLALQAHGNNVEKIFTVAPGGDPAEIELAVQGVNSLRVDPSGELVMVTELGEARFTAPVAYQRTNGQRREVAARYVVNGTSYGLEVGVYDETAPLVIDPLLASTFLGGAYYDYGNALVVVSDTAVYVAGETTSYNFPATAGAYHAELTGASDVFVARFDTNLHQLLACTYIGGSENDWGYALALDGEGNVYISGRTDSTDYPTTAGAYDTTHNGVAAYDPDVYVSKLNGELTQLLASTFLGGSDLDEAHGLVLDSATNVYVTGYTGSTNFPATADAFDPVFNGNNDAFVSKLDAALSAALETPLGVIRDYDADRKADPVVFQESSGIWSVKLSASGYAVSSAILGGAGYTPLSGDFDGDGLGDPAVYQESTGLWQVMLSASGYATATAILGGAGYTPLSGDFDGDGKTDPAVYGESTGLWQVMLSGASYAIATAIMGGAGYTAIPGDFDGDGKADPAVFNESMAIWSVKLSASGYTTTY